MWLFLDDVRQPAFVGWGNNPNVVICRTATEAIALLRTGKVERMSLDHDLGEDAPDGLSGYDVACWCETALHTGELRSLPTWEVHSQNPVGRARIHTALRPRDQPTSP